MPASPKLPDDLEAIVAAYERDSRQRGRYDPHMSWAARRFCVQVGAPAHWRELSLDEQLGLAGHIRAFVSWLFVTGRLSATADYLAVSPNGLGELGAWYFPELHHTILDTATTLGYRGSYVREGFWCCLMKIAALYQVPPSEVGAERLVEGRMALKEAGERLAAEGRRLRVGPGQFSGLANVMFHAGLLDEPVRWPLLRRCDQLVHETAWAQIPEPMASTMRRYLAQRKTVVATSTLKRDDRTIRHFGVFLAGHAPDVTAIAQVRRHHVEAFKTHLGERAPLRPGKGKRLNKQTIQYYLSAMAIFFDSLVEWEFEDRPAGRLIFPGDYPRLDRPLPRFLDDPTAAKLLAAARADDDPFVHLAIELLARTGMRRGELLRLTVDAVVQIGSAYWLRIPVGKMRTDRYVPLHPELKALIDAWLVTRPDAPRSDLLFCEHGRSISNVRLDRAINKATAAAGIGHVTAHQLRHTLATQALNRGMSLDAIAALLGHRDMTMTLVYARIADRTVADQYFSVTEKVEALYDQPKALPAGAEGSEMGRLRRQMDQRMLGNGYCARPVDMDCHFESVCESCSFFVTTVEFRPTLARQRDDAAAKGQIGRQRLFDGLIARLDDQAS